MADLVQYTLELTNLYKNSLKRIKRNKPDLLSPLEAGVAKILRSPELGKPLRNVLRNRRQIHIAGSFVLLYEIVDMEVRLLDFDHHNKIYKKYSSRR
ncbi:MAG TPA: type II toxin-antitoxin system RelE/ParE family toxin [Candidatus Paceibacterota bacterium]